MSRLSTSANAEDVVVEAQKRLAASKSSPLVMKHVQRLQSQYALPDKAVLGLRLLTPIQLQRFVSAEEKNVQARLSSSAPHQVASVLLSAISKLDPKVSGMVAKLTQLDSQGAELPPDEDDAVEVAKVRLQRKQSPLHKMKMEKLQRDFGLGDEILLAMRMLDEENLKELLAGEAHIRNRLAQGEESGALMMWLISQLDSEVETLVAKIVELDGSSTTPVQAASPQTGLKPAPPKFAPKFSSAAKATGLKPAPPKSGLKPGLPKSGLKPGLPKTSLKPAPPKTPPNVQSSGKVTGLKPAPPKTSPYVNSSAKAVGLKPAPPKTPPTGSVANQLKTPPTGSVAHQLPPNGSPRWGPLLRQIYQKYNPSKLGELPTIMAKYTGVEDDLFKALANKYGFPPDKLPVTTTALGGVKRKPESASQSDVQAKKTRLDSSASPAADDGVFTAAQERLEKNKTQANAAALARLKAGNNFSDEVVLALRLIPTARLQELAGRHVELKQQLGAAPDRNQCMMSMIWAIDPDVQTMVRKLVALDNEAGSSSATSSDSSSRQKFIGKPKEPGIPPPVKKAGGTLARQLVRPMLRTSFGKGH